MEGERESEMEGEKDIINKNVRPRGTEINKADAEIDRDG